MRSGTVKGMVAGALLGGAAATLFGVMNWRTERKWCLQAQRVGDKMARKAGEVLGEIDKISASLGKKDGEAPHPEPDKAKNGLREVLNNLRPKTEE